MSSDGVSGEEEEAREQTHQRAGVCTAIALCLVGLLVLATGLLLVAFGVFQQQAQSEGLADILHESDPPPSTPKGGLTASQAGHYNRTLPMSREPGGALGRPVVFVHVPKTGGTTVQELLYESAEQHGLKITHITWRRPSFPWNNQTGFFYGHGRFNDRGYGDQGSHDARGPVSIVTVRDPVSSAISLHDFIMRQTDERDPPGILWRSFFVRGGWSLDDFLDAVRGGITFRGGWPGLSEPHAGTGKLGSDMIVAAFVEHTDKSMQYLCGFDEDCAGTCLEPALQQKRVERALRNLDRIEVVAATERMDDIVPQLQCWLPWFDQTIRALPRINAAHKGDRSKISKVNEEFLRRYASACGYEVLHQRALVLSRLKAMEARACLRSEQG